MILGKASCGVRYAVRQGGSAVAYCALSIRCGTRDEAGYHSGIAHFTEHTLFKGTRRKRAATINNCLEKLGGELNAYTTKEEIVIHATVLKEDLRKAGNLLFELATEATFPEAEIETERGVVSDEIQSYKDSPADDVYDRFEEKLFRGHPLSRPILGTVASVRKITAEELRRFVSERFRPEVMAFTVVADVPEEKMEKDVLRLIGTWFAEAPDREPLTGCPPAGIATPDAARFNERSDKKNHEVNAVIGSYAPSLYEEKERLTASLLGNILGGPASNSILGSILRERNGWVYGVEVSYTQYADTGIMAVCLGCDKSNIDRCLAAVRKEILKIQTLPLSPTRLKAAKRQMLGQLAISSDNGEAQCLSMGKSLLSFGRVASSAEIRTAIEAITAEDLRAMACRIFQPERLSTLIFL